MFSHDRKKEVIVVSTGTNVAPQPIEDEFATNDHVDLILVVGETNTGAKEANR